jgi:hypothetical protein
VSRVITVGFHKKGNVFISEGLSASQEGLYQAHKNNNKKKKENVTLLKFRA